MVTDPERDAALAEWHQQRFLRLNGGEMRSGTMPCGKTMNPTPQAQKQAADAVSAAYEAIREMCGETLACPAPFDEIYHVLMKHIFEIERLR